MAGGRVPLSAKTQERVRLRELANQGAYINITNYYRAKAGQPLQVTPPEVKQAQALIAKRAGIFDAQQKVVDRAAIASQNYVVNQKLKELPESVKQEIAAPTNEKNGSWLIPVSLLLLLIS